jgi:hypothetical protein
MRKITVVSMGLLAICAVPLLAQSAGNETLTALLVEVRLLRQALERSATAPQVQLLGTRLTVQNARVQTAIHDHEAARQALQDVVTAISKATAQLQAVTEESDRAAAGQPRERELEQIQGALKAQVADLNLREPPLRARESELAGIVAAEQNEWLLLNRRLDDFERSLPAGK